MFDTRDRYAALDCRNRGVKTEGFLYAGYTLCARSVTPKLLKWLGEYMSFRMSMAGRMRRYQKLSK